MANVLTGFVCILLAMFIASGLAIYGAGSYLSAPERREMGPPPADLGAVGFEVDGVKGWYVMQPASAPCVILMHGVRADRRSMVERARFLANAGYSSVLFDFQAHGESPGQRITFGYLESGNARSVVNFARSTLSCDRVAALGRSLGGAAALIGTQAINVDALIIESVYPTFEEAVANRLEIYLGKAGRLLAPLLTLQLKPRFGMSADDLRPINRIAKLQIPIYVISGTDDRRTTLKEAQSLYNEANNPKQFWAVEGAGHVDLHLHDRVFYERNILKFLKSHLRAPNGNPADPLHRRLILSVTP